MENTGSVKTEQDEASSVETVNGNAHNAIGDNLSNNRSSASCHPNGVSNFPGKAGCSVMTTELGLLASFRQDAQRSRGDSELMKNCETKWLQLFRLVEKQCQEQMIAQQKVFYHQIHRIQNEIRHLVKLQKQNAPLCAEQNLPVSCTNSLSSLESPMGLQTETLEDNDLFAIGLKPSSSKGLPGTSAAHQGSFANQISASSGYGTSSASELSPSKRQDVPMCMENAAGAAEEQDGTSSTQEDLTTASIENTEAFAPVAGAIGFPAEFEQNSESQCGKASGKPLTSWAQKLRRNQLKRTDMEEGSSPSLQRREPTGATVLENTNLPAVLPPSHTLHLGQQNGSQTSLVSGTSGLTYWKLDEKEMYHSLPKRFEKEFNILSANMSSKQLSSGDEIKPSTLKDIYHQKQRESQQLVDWNFSPSHSTHPPEILTLDPTLHMKPGQQNPGLPLDRFCGSPERVSFSPDSMAEAAFSPPSDTDSLSCANTARPLLAGSPAWPSTPTVDPWNVCASREENHAGSYLHPSHGFLTAGDEDNLTLTPTSTGQSRLSSADTSWPDCGVSATCATDPVALSKIRQNLREKHARHIADLRAYYDSEIQALKQQLEASFKSPSDDLKRINQSLADGCERLEAALNEAHGRVRSLENQNTILETELIDWKDRFCATSRSAQALQERMEETRAGSKEKDNTISRLKRRLKEAEEAFEKACRLSDHKEARLEEKDRMFQNLLREYESLGKEHERVKDTLNVTENKLLDANTQGSDLKRTISKLEAQIKQLEHENVLKLRHLADSHFGTPYATKLASADVSRRKWLIPGSEYSIFTGQPLGRPQESPKDNRLEEAFATSRCHSPPEKDSSPERPVTTEAAKRESRAPETPIIKACKDLEERRLSKNWGSRAGKEEEGKWSPTKPSTRRPAVGFEEAVLNTSRSPEKGRDPLKHNRFSSPGGRRSSSLPPSNRKSNTPTRREIMLTPIAVTHSPKRSPKENLSPGFSNILDKNENMTTRFDIFLDDYSEPAASPGTRYGSPRKRLQFRSAEEDAEELHFPSPGRGGRLKPSPGTDPFYAGAMKGTAETAREEGGSANLGPPCPSSAGMAPYEADSSYVSRIKTLAGTERLFDELTHEKQQIEAQLSRVPCPGGRTTLHARLSQEALEDRLECINRELGSVRMILKRFHVLRTSANT